MFAWSWVYDISGPSDPLYPMVRRLLLFVPELNLTRTYQKQGSDHRRISFNFAEGFANTQTWEGLSSIWSRAFTNTFMKLDPCLLAKERTSAAEQDMGLCQGEGEHLYLRQKRKGKRTTVGYLSPQTTTSLVILQPQKGTNMSLFVWN